MEGSRSSGDLRGDKFYKPRIPLPMPPRPYQTESYVGATSAGHTCTSGGGISGSTYSRLPCPPWDDAQSSAQFAPRFPSTTVCWAAATILSCQSVVEQEPQPSTAPELDPDQRERTSGR